MHAPEIPDDGTKLGKEILEGRTIVMKITGLNAFQKRALSMYRKFS